MLTAKFSLTNNLHIIVKLLAAADDTYISVFRREKPAELRSAAQKPVILRRRPHHIMGVGEGEQLLLPLIHVDGKHISAV